MSDWHRFTRLPESPDYWHGLSGRIAQSAAPHLRRRARSGRWLDAALATGVIGAAALVVLLVAPPAKVPTRATLQAGLGPADPIARALLNRQGPPHISELLPAYAPRDAP